MQMPRPEQRFGQSTSSEQSAPVYPAAHDSSQLVSPVTALSGLLPAVHAPATALAS